MSQRDDHRDLERLQQEQLQQARSSGDLTYLIAALRDPDNRLTAARYLGELRAREAVNQLQMLLGANDPQARAAAARALGDVGATEARPSLRAVAFDERELDWVRAWAINALRNLHDHDALSTLLELLGHDSRKIRGAVILAAKDLGNSGTVAQLRAAKRQEGIFGRFWLGKLYREAIRDLARTP